MTVKSLGSFAIFFLRILCELSINLTGKVLFFVAVSVVKASLTGTEDSCFAQLSPCSAACSLIIKYGFV